MNYCERGLCQDPAEVAISRSPDVGVTYPYLVCGGCFEDLVDKWRRKHITVDERISRRLSAAADDRQTPLWVFEEDLGDATGEELLAEIEKRSEA